MPTTLYARAIVSDVDAALERLSTAAGSSTTTSRTINTSNGATDIVIERYLSAPLSASATISGTISISMQALENNMSANAGGRARVYRYDSSNQTYTQIGTADDGVEFGTTNTQMDWTITPTSTAFNAGDRIAIEYVVTAAGGTMGNGFSCTMFYDGAAGSSFDTSVTFTENLTFSAFIVDVAASESASAGDSWFAPQVVYLDASESGTANDSTLPGFGNLVSLTEQLGRFLRSSAGYIAGGSITSTNPGYDDYGGAYKANFSTNAWSALAASITAGTDRTLTAANTSTKGYAATSNIASGISNQIDALTFSTETFSVTGNTSNSFHLVAGLHSLSSAYWCGGNNGSGTLTNAATKMSFSNESISANSSSLSSNLWARARANGPNYGFLNGTSAAGSETAYAAVLDFSNDTFSNLSSITLPNAIYVSFGSSSHANFSTTATLYSVSWSTFTQSTRGAIGSLSSRAGGTTINDGINAHYCGGGFLPNSAGVSFYQNVSGTTGGASLSSLSVGTSYAAGFYPTYESNTLQVYDSHTATAVTRHFEPVTVADSADAVETLRATRTEAGASTDSTSAGLSIGVDGDESGSADDSSIGGLLYLGDATESVDALDDAPAYLIQRATQTEPGNVAESSASTSTLNVTRTEAGSATDSSTRALSRFAAVIETLNASDVVVAALVAGALGAFFMFFF